MRSVLFLRVLAGFCRAGFAGSVVMRSGCPPPCCLSVTFQPPFGAFLPLSYKVLPSTCPRLRSLSETLDQGSQPGNDHLPGVVFLDVGRTAFGNLPPQCPVFKQAVQLPPKSRQLLYHSAAPLNLQ